MRSLPAEPGTGVPRRLLAILFGLSATLLVAPLGSRTSSAADDRELRICADPNNMPFSNEFEAGFENKLAEMVARSFSERPAYTWWAQRRGFVRNTLKADLCDVVMGVPSRLDMVETTRPYYRSSYVFVSRADRKIGIRSIKDPRLKDLKIGVHLIGNDGFNTPPAHAFAQQEMVENVVGFTIYGDYRQPDPPARLIDWGPLAGYFAKHSLVPLKITPIEDTEQFAPLLFLYDIAMGVRKGDHELKKRLDGFIEQHRSEIQDLLTSYGVPLVQNGTREIRNDTGTAQ
jgi:quinoprotein dehydrogenase-associated probable ABC transporter substrate-binding protein